MFSAKQKLGRHFEQKAESYLHHQGLTTVARNYHCRFGEIDLIMQHLNDIVFIEVRSRSQIHYGTSAETILRTKQLKIIRTAQYYLQQQKLTDKVPCRFDVIAIDKKQEINWIQNAFGI